MPSPTQLAIVMVPNATANSVVIPISASLQALDSTTPGSAQSGYSAADIAVRNIFKTGVFTADGKTWFAASQIISIVAS